MNNRDLLEDFGNFVLKVFGSICKRLCKVYWHGFVRGWWPLFWYMLGVWVTFGYFNNFEFETRLGLSFLWPIFWFFRSAIWVFGG